MQSNKFLLLLGVTLAAITCSATSIFAGMLIGSNYKTDHVISTGGGKLAGTGYKLDCTIGQPVAGGKMSGTQYTTETGFLMSYAVSPEPLAHGTAIDMNLATRNYDDSSVSATGIESSIVAAVDDVILAGVVAQNVTNLDTYQVEVHFNPAQLQFIAGFEDNALDGITNLLKKNGGTTIWMPPTETTPGTVTIASSLTGSDPAEAPEGSGIIALLQFKVLDSSSPKLINLNNVFFVNSSGQNQSVANLTGGEVTIGMIDTDNDGIDDNWEIFYFGDLSTANGNSDFDKDGYTDLQEFLNSEAGELDPEGAAYNPKVKNAPGGTGYAQYHNSFWQMMLPAILNNSSK